MKIKLGIRNLFMVIALAVVAGCATARVDWNARVGVYTFDQAVVELGPPDKQQLLTDGKNVAEWITRSGSGGSVIVGTGFYHYPMGVGVVQTSPNYYESKLLLTFGTNQVLTAWAKK